MLLAEKVLKVNINTNYFTLNQVPTHPYKSKSIYALISSHKNSYRVALLYPYPSNRISRVMVSMLALSVVDHGFEHLWGQTKDYKIGICSPLSTQHEGERSKTG